MRPLLAETGDRAFEVLYRRHAAEVYRYAFGVMRNASDAEDVTQTTFLNAYRAFLRGERPRAPLNWLIAIAHNVCRERRRQSSRRPVEVALAEMTLAATREDERWSAGEIRRALSQLTFNQRAALVLRELEGRSYAEIAETLNLSLSAVETVVFRARRSLREQLQGTLSCAEAGEAVTRQLAGELPRSERAALRAHLRQCTSCTSLARRKRGRRGVAGLALFPLPFSFKSLIGAGGASGGASLGAGVAAKAAAVAVAGVVVAGAGYEGVHRAGKHRDRLPVAAAPSASPAARPAPPRPVVTTARRRHAPAVVPATTAVAIVDPTDDPAFAPAPTPVTALPAKLRTADRPDPVDPTPAPETGDPQAATPGGEELEPARADDNTETGPPAGGNEQVSQGGGDEQVSQGGGDEPVSKDPVPETAARDDVDDEQAEEPPAEGEQADPAPEREEDPAGHADG